MEIGKLYPLSIGACGKVLAAFLPEAEFEQVLEKYPLAQLGPGAIVDRNALREHLAQVKRQRYAVSVEERVMGGAGVSAPIFDDLGNLAASVGLYGPASRFTSEVEKRLISLVQETASKISRALGYSGNSR